MKHDKMIKVTWDGQMSILPFPDDLEGIYKALDAELFQVVTPGRLYTEFGVSKQITHHPGESVLMLCDEEGKIKGKKLNILGSYLYGTDINMDPIVGDVLFIGQGIVYGEPDFCGMDELTLDRLTPAFKDFLDLFLPEKNTIKEVLA